VAPGRVERGEVLSKLWNVSGSVAKLERVRERLVEGLASTRRWSTAFQMPGVTTPLWVSVAAFVRVGFIDLRLGGRRERRDCQPQMHQGRGVCCRFF
jgi:hypothetical protein